MCSEMQKDRSGSRCQRDVLRFALLIIVLGFFLPSCALLPTKQMYSEYTVGDLDYTNSTYNTLLSKITMDCAGPNKDNTGTPDQKKGAGTQPSEEDTSDGSQSSDVSPPPVVCRKCVNGTILDDQGKMQCAYQRDLAIGDLIGISDTMCEAHMRTIYGNDASFNITMGTFTNAFSGAATIVGGEGSKSILAALAFFFNSERSLVNETVYKSVLIPAIVKKINDSRQTSRRALVEKYEANKGTNYEKYPMNIALLDILAYHQNCSFLYGLQKALEEGTQNTKDRDLASLEQKRNLLSLQYDARIRELQKLAPGDKVTDKQMTDDLVLKGLKAQIEVVNSQIEQLQKQQTQSADTKAAAKTDTPSKVTGTFAGTSANTLTLKTDKDVPRAFDVTGKAVPAGLKEGDGVTVEYTQGGDGKLTAKTIEKEADQLYTGLCVSKDSEKKTLTLKPAKGDPIVFDTSRVTSEAAKAACVSGKTVFTVTYVRTGDERKTVAEKTKLLTSDLQEVEGTVEGWDDKALTLQPPQPPGAKARYEWSGVAVPKDLKAGQAVKGQFYAKETTNYLWTITPGATQ